MGPPLLQTTHNALSVINITIFLINALIIFVKDVIKETLEILFSLTIMTLTLICYCQTISQTSWNQLPKTVPQ